MKPLSLALAVIAVVALLAFLPALLAMVLDPLARRSIIRHCESHGLKKVEVKVFRNHYGVSFEKADKRRYAKCRVVLGKIKWHGSPPESV